MASELVVQGVVRVLAGGKRAKLDIQIVEGPAPATAISATALIVAGIIEKVNNGEIAVHPSRLPLAKATLHVMVNNVQTSLKYKKGKDGEWSNEAEAKLAAILCKALNKRAHTSVPVGGSLLMLADVDQPPSVGMIADVPALGVVGLSAAPPAESDDSSGDTSSCEDPTSDDESGDSSSCEDRQAESGSNAIDLTIELARAKSRLAMEEECSSELFDCLIGIQNENNDLRREVKDLKEKLSAR
jgi:hypothetical protein